MSNPVHSNILAFGVEIKGTIKFQGDLFIDGIVEGEISSPGNLVIGEHADIQGEIRTKTATIHGSVQSNITTEERCELKAGSMLMGDLKSARLIIEDGATFIGRSEVTPKTQGQEKNKPAFPPPIAAIPA